MKGEVFSAGNLQKISIIVFVAGWLFMQPLLTGIGAIGFGVTTLYELFAKKGKK